MASVFSLLESEQHGAEGLWPTALGEHCPVAVLHEEETSEVVSSHGQTSKKVCVCLAGKKTEASLRGMARESTSQ